MGSVALYGYGPSLYDLSGYDGMIRAKRQDGLSPEAIFRLMSETPDNKLVELSQCLIRRGQPKARVQATLNEYIRQRRWWDGSRLK